MRHIVKTTVLAGALAGLFLISGATRTAQADDRHHWRHDGDRHFGLAVNVGGVGVYGGGGYLVPSYYYAAPRPACYQYERVFVSGYVDSCGFYHPGYYRTVQVCRERGRVVLGGY